MTTELAEAVEALTKPRAQINPYTDVPFKPQAVMRPALLVSLEDAIRGTLGRDAASKVASAFERNILDAGALFDSMLITSAIRTWCGMVKVRPSKNVVDDLSSWQAAFTGSPEFYIEKLAEWERTILALLDPTKTVELTEACPVCESSAWQDEAGGWWSRPLVIQYRKSDPEGTAGAWCRVESCEAVWEDLFALRKLSAQIGTDPAVMLAFLRSEA